MCTTSLEATANNTIQIPWLFSLLMRNLEKRKISQNLRHYIHILLRILQAAPRQGGLAATPFRGNISSEPVSYTENISHGFKLFLTVTVTLFLPTDFERKLCQRVKTQLICRSGCRATKR